MKRRPKNPYRTPAKPPVEPGGFRCGPEAFLVLGLVIAIVSFFDAIRS